MIKEAIPAIYYMLSWMENNLENNNNLTGLDNTINFTIKLLFYENEKEEDKKFGPEGITALKIENLDEDILTKIKTRINEELEKSSDLTIITNFVQIIVIFMKLYILIRKKIKKNLYKLIFSIYKNMYCVKCKKQTSTTNEQFTVSKNKRNMKRGTCVICGTTKTQFIKAQKGGSLLNKFINNLPVEMQLPGHNFTGPGTKLNKRLNPDLTPKSWSKPINRVDKAAFNHDVCYLKDNDTATRNAVCDKNMLKELKGIYNPTIKEKMERGLVSSLIGTKARFGWGLNKKKFQF